MPSKIASRLTSDTAVIEQVVGTTVSVALRNIVTGVGGIAYLFTLAPKLTAMLLLGIPVVVLPIMFIGRRLRALSRTSQEIGRASCRERVCQYVYISVVAVSLKKKTSKMMKTIVKQTMTA